MDSYANFQLILNKWIRFVGSLMGMDILNKDFKITVHTIIVIIIAFLLPTFYGWTIYAYDGKLAIEAMDSDVMLAIFDFIILPPNQSCGYKF